MSSALTTVRNPGAPLRVLIVDDSADDADLMIATLETASFAVAAARVDTAEAMAESLERDEWDVVLCDHAMPRFDSTGALAVMARAGSAAPAIIVSDAIGEEATVAAMRAGAVDFVSKSRLVRLPPAVQRALDEATHERERERLEAELDQARRLEAIGRLAGGVAHALNNKLAVILGFNNLVVAALGDGHPLQRQLGEIRTAAEQSAELTRDLLAFGRRQMLEPEALIAGQIADLVRRIVEPGFGPAIEVRIEDGSLGAQVLADRGQIEQVLLSLALNARDAMPDGGRLTIRTDAIAAPSGSACEPGTVKISFTDTGRGMSDETRERVFEPFFTTKEAGSGMGLGLAAVLGIVEQSGGTIQVDSRLGHGTTFTIDLPEHRDTATIDCARAARPPEPISLTVLLVEDDQPVRDLIVLMLQDAGHDVLSAATGAEALAILGDPAHGINVLMTDMILTDLRGVDLAAEALRLRPELRLIYASGYPGDAAIHDGGPPYDAFLSKPFTGEEVAAAVQQAASARVRDERGPGAPA